MVIQNRNSKVQIFQLVMKDKDKEIAKKIRIRRGRKTFTIYLKINTKS
jgi:hypothetical protein